MTYNLRSLSIIITYFSTILHDFLFSLFCSILLIFWRVLAMCFVILFQKQFNMATYLVAKFCFDHDNNIIWIDFHSTCLIKKSVFFLFFFWLMLFFLSIQRLSSSKAPSFYRSNHESILCYNVNSNELIFGCFNIFQIKIIIFLYPKK